MPSAGKRGPAALVTDARERSDPSGPQRQSQAQAQAANNTRNAMRFMTVDNILQYASDIPSARPRHSPTPSPTPQRTAFSPAPASHPSASPSPSSMSSVSSSSSSSASASPAPHNYIQPQRKPNFGAGGGLPNAPSRAGQAMPSRTTKISEKLVLLPEADTPSDDGDDGDGDDGDDGDDDCAGCSDRDDDAGDETGPPPGDRDRPGSPPTGLYQLQPKQGDDPIKRRIVAEMEAGHVAGLGRPLRSEELDVLRKRGGIRGKSYAERLPKPRRAEEKVSRVTAYCTAEAFKTKDVAEFLRLRHEAKTKLYDDCLYTIYSLPLLPGTDGFRLRSRPMLRTPGLSGKTVLDLEIEQSEQRDHHEGYFDEYSYGGDGGSVAGTAGYRSSTEGGGSEYRSSTERAGGGHDGGSRLGALGDGLGDGRAGAATGEDGTAALRSPVSPINRLAPEAKNFAEMFVLSYGVVVFWNFTEAQEKDILADLAFAANKHHHHHYHHHHHHHLPHNPHHHPPPHQHRSSPSSALVARPLPQENVETEEFHFEYSSEIARPRIFNDMITLLPRSDHMVKLTISHAIAQSTKLCFFEERMAETMLSAQHVPKTMALTGQLNMERKEVLKMMGRLFKNRVEINLSSNILDVPNFFWDSEPTLHPLYGAIRDYLEIDLRIRVLNERCRVFLDLSAILSDSVADSKMNLITWIIIVLIVVSIVIEVTEVILRTAIIKRGTATDPLPLPGAGQPPMATARLMARGLGLPEGIGIEDLRRWSALLAEEDHSYVCGESIVDRRAGLRPEY